MFCPCLIYYHSGARWRNDIVLLRCGKQKGEAVNLPLPLAVETKNLANLFRDGGLAWAGLNPASGVPTLTKAFQSFLGHPLSSG